MELLPTYGSFWCVDNPLASTLYPDYISLIFEFFAPLMMLLLEFLCKLLKMSWFFGTDTDVICCLSFVIFCVLPRLLILSIHFTFCLWSFNGINDDFLARFYGVICDSFFNWPMSYDEPSGPKFLMFFFIKSVFLSGELLNEELFLPLSKSSLSCWVIFSAAIMSSSKLSLLYTMVEFFCLNLL